MSFCQSFEDKQARHLEEIICESLETNFAHLWPWWRWWPWLVETMIKLRIIVTLTIDILKYTAPAEIYNLHLFVCRDVDVKPIAWILLFQGACLRICPRHQMFYGNIWNLWIYDQVVICVVSKIIPKFQNVNLVDEKHQHHYLQILCNANAKW